MKKLLCKLFSKFYYKKKDICVNINVKEIIQIEILPVLSHQYQCLYFYKKVKMFSCQMAKIFWY